MNGFGNKIRSLREERKLPLRTVAAFLDIDQAILSKMERGQRQANRDQISKLAFFFHVEENDLRVLWLSDKLVEIISDEEVALQALRVAEETVVYQKKRDFEGPRVLEELTTILKQFPVNRAWLFGSFSRHEETAESDLDLLIDVPSHERFTLFDMAELKEQVTKLYRREADIVMLSALKPQVRERVAADMKLIYERG